MRASTGGNVRRLYQTLLKANSLMATVETMHRHSLGCLDLRATDDAAYSAYYVCSALRTEIATAVTETKYLVNLRGA
jgi:hypothetical protein